MSAGRYELLQETWIYQDIQQLVTVEVRKQQLVELRRVLQEIVHVRFPRLEKATQHVAEQLDHLEHFYTIIVRIGSAKNEKEARQALLEVEKMDCSGLDML